MRLLRKGLEKSREDVVQLLSRVKEDLTNPSIHGYWNVYGPLRMNKNSGEVADRTIVIWCMGKSQRIQLTDLSRQLLAK